MTRRPTANELIAMALDGATVDIVTMTRVTRIDRKTVQRFAKIGRPVLRDSTDGRLMVSAGKKYLDCSYNTLRITDATGSSRSLPIGRL
jgi:hypothetical protein